MSGLIHQDESICLSAPIEKEAIRTKNEGQLGFFMLQRREK